MNQATRFLKGLIPSSLRSECTLYVGYQDVTPELWGDYLYIQTNAPTIFQAFEKEMPDIELEIVNEDQNLYRYSFSSEVYTKIVNPFLNGKYSSICRKYVERTFPSGNLAYLDEDWLPVWETTLEFLVCTKSDIIRRHWKEIHDILIPEDAEVWSKPEMENEIFAYEDSSKYCAENARSEFGPSGIGKIPLVYKGES